MDVFDLRDTVAADYSSYVRSFVTIRDERVNRFVDQRLNEGRLWPDPLVQQNPAFAVGKSFPELVEAGTLHPESGNIFRRDKRDTITSRAPLRLHRHQLVGVVNRPIR